MPYGEGMHVDFRGPDGSIGLTVQGRLGNLQGQALDQRTKFARWLQEFPLRGGKLIIHAVSVADLEKIAAESDLTMVAAGKGQINAFFARDDERSIHTVPPRRLAAMLLSGPGLAREHHHFGGLPQAGAPVRALLAPADRRRSPGTVVEATPAQIEQAVARAVAAQPAWNTVPVTERAACLERAADAIEAQPASSNAQARMVLSAFGCPPPDDIDIRSLLCTYSLVALSPGYRAPPAGRAASAIPAIRGSRPRAE